MKNGSNTFISMIRLEFSKQMLLPLDNVQIIFPSLEFRLSFFFLLTTRHTLNHIILHCCLQERFVPNLKAIFKLKEACNFVWRKTHF